MRQTLNDCVRHITQANPDARVLMFAGAGAGHSLRVAESLRLPLGTQIRDHLLLLRYPDDGLSAQDRVNLFQTENGQPATPDLVWHKLIQEKQALATWTRELADLFGPERPTPSAYYMLARWFFSAPNCGGIATTNFDEKLNSALTAVGAGLKRLHARDYTILSVEDDFRYALAGSVDPRRCIQKLHGTLGMAWSIRAGVPGPAGGGATESVHFSPYEMLAVGLKNASHWVFLGYSFKDTTLTNQILDAYKEKGGVTIYIVDRQPSEHFHEQCTRIHKTADVHSIEADAETFLEHVLARLGVFSTAAVSRLSSAERATLVEGPKFLSGCIGRKTSVDNWGSSGPKFQDPVHGTFSYSEAIEKPVIDLIDCGELQRLRYIKQLSFVHLKHPGATHDRFSHSLGVTHLADRLFASLKSHRPERMVGNQSLLNDQTHLALAVACLFHDTGHGPLGHTMDLVRRRRHIAVTHEADSIRIFDQASNASSFADLHIALNRIGVSRETVCQILAGKHVLSLLLSNSGLDLDRLDFILRDGYNTICSLAEESAPPKEAEMIRSVSAAVNVLLQSVIVRLDPATGIPVVGYALEAHDAIATAAKVYSYMYDNVYHCWQNVAAQAMMAIAIEELLRSARDEWLDIIRLTDVELFAALEDFENPTVRELAYLVKYRRLFDFGGEATFKGILQLDEGRLMDNLRTSAHTHAAGLGASGDVTILAVILNPKSFRARFVSNETIFAARDGILGPEKVLSETLGRIMFFRWPGVAFNIEQLRPALTDVLSRAGVSLMDIRPPVP